MEQPVKSCTNGFIAHQNGLNNGTNGYTNGHHKHGISHGTNGLTHQNGFHHELHGYHKGPNGYQNGYINGTNGHHIIPLSYKDPNNNTIISTVAKPVAKTILKITRRLLERRIKVALVLLMLTSHAFMTSLLSYKPAFQTVAPMAITVCTDLISTALAVLGTLWYDCGINTNNLKEHLYTYLCQRPKDTLLAAVIMVISPVLDQLQALALRDVGTRGFKVVNHMGVMVTLMACYYTFGRKPRALQVWGIIFFVGCTQMMEYTNCPRNQDFSAPHKLARYIWVTVSWAAITIKMVITSLYVVYLENFIRCDNKVSVWTRLVQIGVWKTVIDVIRMLNIDGAYIQENGFFSGFNPLVLLYILLRSFSVILGFLSILHCDSVGKTLQQKGGILLGMQISSIILSNDFCLFSFVSCLAAVMATIAYLQWNGHGKDLIKNRSEVSSPAYTWEVWYLETMNGDVITLWVHAAVTYVLVWCFILYSVGEKMQKLLMKSMTPFLVLILLNIILCFRLRVTSSRFVFRSSVLVCFLSLVSYITLIIMNMDIHVYLVIS